jgi:hypothetical protein
LADRQHAKLTRSAHCFNLLFRPSFLARVAEGTQLPFVAEIARSTGLRMPSRREAVGAYLERAYDFMKDSCPSEYAYKNEVTNRLFLARHDVTRAAIVSEFRILDARADLVVLNGSSSGYEIKTRYDSLNRLPSQLEAYFRVLDRVIVVSSECHLDEVLRIAQPAVGVITFGASGTLSTVREPKSNADHVDPGAIFDCLRRREYVAAVEEQFGAQPTMPNTEIYARFRQLFVKLQPRVAHGILVSALTGRLRLDARKDAIEAVPYSLKQTYFDASVRDRRRLFAGDMLRRRLTSFRNIESEAALVFSDTSGKEI